MQNRTASTNIIRDEKSVLDYIVTRNAVDIYSRILFNYKSGQHAFNIIGSYGTGKSTFLWALEKHLKGETVFFKEHFNGHFSGFKRFEFVKFVGRPVSLRASFAQEFNSASDDSTSIIKAIANKSEALHSKKKVLVIFIDEFGKHLEYASKKDVDEIYFVQELAEYCNSPKQEILLITTLHQNFGGYARGLDKTQRDEWHKVKGRLTDLTFDEPVEQLLFFASEKLAKLELPANKVKSWERLSKTILDSGLVGSINIEGLEGKLFPLDLLAAHTLTHALQKYGQNERSLFSFIDSKDLKEFSDDNRAFTVADVFDYLRKNLSAELQDGEKNPHKAQWIAASKAIEKAEGMLQEKSHTAIAILKTIALVNIFGREGGLLDADVLSAYIKELFGKATHDVISKLEQNKLIKFFRHRNKLNFIDGTDVDIQQELFNASKYIDHDIDLTVRLKSYFSLPFISLKKTYYIKGTPRYFAYRFISDASDVTAPTGELDGYINVLVTNHSKLPKQIVAQYEGKHVPQVFLVFKDIVRVKEHLIELDKINFLIEKHREDKVAVQLFNEERHFVIRQLEIDFLQAKFHSSKVKWFWNGEQLRNINSIRNLNRALSDICDEVYTDVPVYRNELCNRERLSIPILTARKALLRSLLSFGNKEDLAYEAGKFPPDKTIYLSLLKATGIHRKGDSGVWEFGAPTDESFTYLWEQCRAFLDSARNNKRNLQDFYDLLIDPEGLKLKRGFLDFWIPIFLVTNKEKYALYFQDEDHYIPFLDSDVLDLLHKKPGNYIIKTFNTSSVSNLWLNEYNDLTGLKSEELQGIESSSITIFSNFMRFYRGLNPYAQTTRGISSAAIKLRDAIGKSAKDPYNALFEKMPAALGFYPLRAEQSEAYRLKLEDAIREIRSSYDDLLSQIEVTLLTFLGGQKMTFESYKESLNTRFKYVKSGLLSEKQRVFYNRVNSPLDDRASYLKSLADFILGRPLDKIKDQEVPGMLDALTEYLDRLNDVVDLHKSSANGLELVQMRLLGPDGEVLQKQSVDLNQKINVKLEKQMEGLLTGSSQENIEVLIRMLKKQIDLNNG
jgi:hypothetical protein